MDKREKQIKETKSKDYSKSYDDPPVHAEHTLKQDVERKREKVEKSSLGGL